MVKFGYNLGMCISILQSKAFNFCIFISFFIENFGFLFYHAIKAQSRLREISDKSQENEIEVSEITGKACGKIFGRGEFNW
jgi:hypothetical protein